MGSRSESGLWSRLPPPRCDSPPSFDGSPEFLEEMAWHNWWMGIHEPLRLACERRERLPSDVNGTPPERRPDSALARDSGQFTVWRFHTSLLNGPVIA